MTYPGGVLRFLTCGSVDDGKSTLIGRLLHDAGLLYDDQVDALENDRRISGELDFSLLLDGLQAEREQGITIDVAYRYFSTKRRRFIVADTPGHVEYTRNMATGASTSELAVILVDAQKRILPQTRRHSFIASLFGITQAVLAINKMDLVDYDEDVFERIVSDYRDATAGLHFKDVVAIPVSALKGDNLFEGSERTPWYEGPTLMEHLEAVDVSKDRAALPFRMPVQLVNRPNAEFRGYSGTVVSGTIRTGDTISISPSQYTSKIARIVTADGDLESASDGEAITVTLEDDIDVGRGNMITSAATTPQISDQFRVHLLWLNADPLLPGRTYELNLGGQQTIGTVSDIRYVVNVETLEHVAAQTLTLNQIGVCNLNLHKALAYDTYDEIPETGRFILIDRYTKHTVAAGIVNFGLHRAANIERYDFILDKQARALLKKQKACVIWFTGLSGSGKSTIASRVEAELHAIAYHTYILDGDNVRHGLNHDLGFTDADRVENIRRIGEVTKLFVEAGLIVLVSFISPFRSEREMARNLLENDEFIEVFIDTPIDICEARDPKGLYRKARAGEISNFTGIDSPYEPPISPELRLETTNCSEADTTTTLMECLRSRGII